MGLSFKRTISNGDAGESEESSDEGQPEREEEGSGCRATRLLC